MYIELKFNFCISVKCITNDNSVQYNYNCINIDGDNSKIFTLPIKVWIRCSYEFRLVLIKSEKRNYNINLFQFHIV